MTQPLDKFIAELEAGLEGVTDGEWRTQAGANSHVYDTIIENINGSDVAFANEPDAAHIARCSKPNMIALLDERTALKAEIARLREALEKQSAWLSIVRNSTGSVVIEDGYYSDAFPWFDPKLHGPNEIEEEVRASVFSARVALQEGNNNGSANPSTEGQGYE